MVVERSVQTVEGLVRILLSACERGFMTRIRLEQEVAMFMAEYATLLAIDWKLGRMAELGTKDAAGSEGQSPKTDWRSSVRYGSTACSWA